MTPEQRRIRSALGGLATAARHDPNLYTVPAREAFERRFLDEVDPDRSLPEPERLRRAQAARRAHFLRLSLKASRARSAKKGSPPTNDITRRGTAKEVSGDQTARSQPRE